MKDEKDFSMIAAILFGIFIIIISIFLLVVFSVAAVKSNLNNKTNVTRTIQ